MIMENENVNQISYESLKQSYDQLLLQAQELDRRYQLLLQDRMIEKIKVMCKIVEHKDAYAPSVVDAVNWHLEQMFAIPAKSE